MKADISMQLKKELEFLTVLERKVQKRLEHAPEGSLHIKKAKKGNIFYRYWGKGSAKHGASEYIRKEDFSLVKMLAQKKYDTGLIFEIRAQKGILEVFLKKHNNHALQKVYEKIPQDHKDLILPEVVDDETYARKWQNVSYSPGTFASDAARYRTMRGEMVRSKTEKIIADTLYQKGIPYRYEYPVQLKDGRVWRPDFMILNKRTRQEYILEHLGMMDDPEYCSRAIGKISLYMQNEIFPGEQLLLTFESKSRPFATEDLELLIEHYLA